MNKYNYIIPIIIVGFIAGWLLFSTQNETKDSFTLSQKEEIEQIVETFLIEKPDVLLKASQELQKRNQNQQEPAVVETIKNNRDELLNPYSPIIGNPDGKLILVKFMDYQCGHCKRMEPVVAELITENPDLKVIIKELPVMNNDSLVAAKMALAANKQDGFTEIHKRFLQENSPLTLDKITEIANELDLDTDQLKKDMEDPAITSELSTVRSLAQQLTVRGTPYFILMNEDETGSVTVIPGTGSKEQFQQLINNL